MSERTRSAVALAAWTAFLAAALVVLHALGDGPLAAPPLDGFSAWLGGRDAPTVAFAFLRLGLLGTGWYLLLATLSAVALRVVRADAAAAAVESCTPAPVRRLVRAAAGLSLAASVAVVSAAAASETEQPVTMRRLPDAATGAPSGQDEPATMRRLPDVAPVPAAAAATHTVVPGEHLWSIAERSLEAAWQRPPTDAEIDPYWRRLVATNRPRLPDPTNADWIVPALELELPPLPPPPPTNRP